MEVNPAIEISVVSPVYGCGGCLEELVAGLQSVLEGRSFEIILVEDGSPDHSWEKMAALARKYPFVKAFKLSRNFGQHAAIQAGLSQVKGKTVVVMDCDLQDPPAEIPKLLAKYQEGYDLVVARRQNRTDGWFKRKSSEWFYRTLSYLTETKIDPSVANFGVYDRKVIDAVLAMGDFVRFFPSMAAWVGFNRGYLDIEHGERGAGVSAYNFGKLVRLGLNVILTFSDKPLRLMVKLGFWVTFLVVISGLITLGRYFAGDIQVSGYTSLILSVWFLGGLVISVLGLVGLYVGKTFDQAKDRPVFIISEKAGHED